MSFLNADEPSACDLVTDFGCVVLWPQSLGHELSDDIKRSLQKCIAGILPLDILVFEGSVINAPDGTGMWNRFCGRPIEEWVAELSAAVRFVAAIGGCASWGGIPATAPSPNDSEGLQFIHGPAFWTTTPSTALTTRSPRPVHKVVYAALSMTAAARPPTECRAGTSTCSPKPTLLAASWQPDGYARSSFAEPACRMPA